MLFNGKVDIKFIEKMVVREDPCSFKMVVREVWNGGERGSVFQANADYNDWLY